MLRHLWLIILLTDCKQSNDQQAIPTGRETSQITGSEGEAAASSTSDATSNASPNSTSPTDPSVTPKLVVEDLSTQFPGSKLYYADDGIARPGIVMLHGSEGGAEGLNYAQQDAIAWVKSGFVVLFYCYYKCQGRPAKLLRIPLDGTIEALRYLQQSSHASGNKIGLNGTSRGAEQSILIGSLLKSTDLVSAIGVHAPSNTVVGAYDPDTMQGVIESGGQRLAPAWTFQGQDLFGETDPSFSTPGPRIAIETYQGPLFVSHGEQDEIWSVDRTKAIELSRKNNSSAITEIKYWPGEGHVLEQSFTTMFAAMTKFFQTHLGASNINVAVDPSLENSSASSATGTSDSGFSNTNPDPNSGADSYGTCRFGSSECIDDYSAYYCNLDGGQFQAGATCT